MTSTLPFAPGIQADPALHIRTANEPLEISQLRAVLDREHYLKAGRPAGHVLWQGVYQQDLEEGRDQLVAVLCWAGAAKRLNDRDTWIGWDAVTCANRLKLVVQLRRFLVPEGARRPNLASQCLGLALRQLPDAWQEKHGYRPLLAESFHDPAVHQGTLYKVTNWIPLGFTKGFKRHRADFYQDLQSPKQLWLRPLQKNARQLLGQPGSLPEEHRQGIAQATCGARSALSCNALRSLKDAFKQVDDPRNPKNRRHPLRALLGLLTYGLLCGAPDVKAIWAKCGPLNQHQRAAIGLTRRDKKSGLLTLPGYDALNDIVNQINPNSLAHAINQWLAANSDLLPKTLALDGKDLGGKGKLGALVTLCHHHTGAPLAMRTYSGDKNDCELPVSQILLKQAAPILANAVITGDALNAQKKRRSSSPPPGPTFTSPSKTTSPASTTWRAES